LTGASPATPAERRVAAIVVHFNGEEVSRLALASLSGVRTPGVEWVLLDNGSTDGSGERLRAAFPAWTHVRVEPNAGASSGYAHALAWGIERGFDYVLLLNNDLEVDPAFLDELLAVAERDARIGCVGPKTYYHGDRPYLWSAGGRLRYREAVTAERGMGQRDHGQYERDEEVGYVNGAAILIRRAAALAAGNWDPFYFICVDDADFCTRVKRAGFTCWYAHRAIVDHMVSRTTGGYTEGRNFRLGRSTAIYVRRYASAGQKASFLFWTSLAAAAASLRELPRGNVGAVAAKLRGVRAGLREPLPPSPRFV
jgi:GT2 family glycosyltransferase